MLYVFTNFIWYGNSLLNMVVSICPNVDAIISGLEEGESYASLLYSEVPQTTIVKITNYSAYVLIIFYYGFFFFPFASIRLLECFYKEEENVDQSKNEKASADKMEIFIEDS